MFDIDNILLLVLIGALIYYTYTQISRMNQRLSVIEQHTLKDLPAEELGGEAVPSQPKSLFDSFGNLNNILNMMNPEKMSQTKFSDDNTKLNELSDINELSDSEEESEDDDDNDCDDNDDNDDEADECEDEDGKEEEITAEPYGVTDDDDVNPLEHLEDIIKSSVNSVEIKLNNDTEANNTDSHDNEISSTSEEPAKTVKKRGRKKKE